MINWTQMLEAIQETVYMTFMALILSVIFGLIVGIILYLTQKDGLLENLWVYRIVNFLVNVLRAVPFIILMILLFDFTILIVGRMLGPSAAIPALVVSATPFFARMCMIAFQEVNLGTIEASIAMGATKLQIIYKVLIPEALPALVSGITVLAISLIGYTAMAGAIGSGGLGNLAYLYGVSRRNNAVLYVATAVIVLIVFIIQFIGDTIVKKIDKR